MMMVGKTYQWGVMARVDTVGSLMLKTYRPECMDHTVRLSAPTPLAISALTFGHAVGSQQMLRPPALAMQGTELGNAKII